MTVLFYILVGLGLVIIRTTLIPSLPFFEKFYDLLIPIVVFLSFYRPKWQGIPIVLFLGFIMDSLCGGPPGLYMLTYLWLYAAMRWMAQFLHTGSLVLLALAVTIGVSFEIAVLLGYMAVISPEASVPGDAAKTVVIQIVWALITGPIIMVVIGLAQKRIDSWRIKIFADR